MDYIKPPDVVAAMLSAGQAMVSLCLCWTYRPAAPTVTPADPASAVGAFAARPRPAEA